MTQRQSKLQKVYREFDLDGSGEVGFDELLTLGQTRRKLGQKGGRWTDAMNDTLMKRIGMDRKGNLPEANFVKYFDETLPNDKADFEENIEQFMTCATACRQKAIRKKTAGRYSPASKPSELVTSNQKAFDSDKWREREEKAKAKAAAKAQEDQPKVSAADEANWREREEKAKRKAAAKTEEDQPKMSAADEANWREREEKAKRKAAAKTEEDTPEVSAADSDKWREREEKAKRNAAARAQEDTPKVSASDEAKWKVREERARMKAVTLAASEEPSVSSAKLDPQTDRLQKLRRVYCEFDLDGGGDVGFDELLVLGQTRRKLGQKSGEWTHVMNDNLMHKIGRDHQGNLPERNFVKYFNETLPSDSTAFDKIVKQFMDCANALRKKKIEQREAVSRPKPTVEEALQSPTSPRQEHKGHRLAQLQKVYRVFDLDGGGDVGFDELLILGETRRKLGQKDGEWTRAMNDNLMRNIGTDRRGNLPETNFVKYFDENLPSDKDAFDMNVKQFMACAEACRKRKLEKREMKKTVDPGPTEIDLLKQQLQAAQDAANKAHAQLERENQMLREKLEAALKNKGVSQDEFDCTAKAKERAERDAAAAQKEAAKHEANARTSKALAEEGASLLQWKNRELEKFRNDAERYRELAERNGTDRDKKQARVVQLEEELRKLHAEMSKSKDQYDRDRARAEEDARRRRSEEECRQREAEAEARRRNETQEAENNRKMQRVLKHWLLRFKCKAMNQWRDVCASNRRVHLIMSRVTLRWKKGRVFKYFTKLRDYSEAKRIHDLEFQSGGIINRVPIQSHINTMCRSSLASAERQRAESSGRLMSPRISRQS